MKRRRMSGVSLVLTNKVARAAAAAAAAQWLRRVDSDLGALQPGDDCGSLVIGIVEQLVSAGTSIRGMEGEDEIHALFAEACEWVQKLKAAEWRWIPEALDPMWVAADVSVQIINRQDSDSLIRAAVWVAAAEARIRGELAAAA